MAPRERPTDTKMATLMATLRYWISRGKKSEYEEWRDLIRAGLTTELSGLIFKTNRYDESILQQDPDSNISISASLQASAGRADDHHRVGLTTGNPPGRGPRNRGLKLTRLN